MDYLKNLTDEEIKIMINKINNEYNALAKERDSLQKVLNAREKEIKMQERNHFTDKCFITKDYSENTSKHIKAFKILEIDKNCDFANCLVLIDGSNQYKINKGVTKTKLWLWYMNADRLMYDSKAPKMIDMYKEIPEEEFNKMLNEYKAELV